MPENITQIKLKFSCGENWDAMHAVENGGRHCDQCHKVVYDFTNSKADEFRKILAENNYNVCGRFTSNQMAAKPFPFWKRWVSAAMVLIGFNFTGCRPDEKTPKEVILKQKPIARKQDIFIGKALILPPVDTANAHHMKPRFPPPGLSDK